MRRTHCDRRSRVILRATGDDGFDGEAFIKKFQDKFEQTENKPVVIGYGVAGLVAFLITEWLIHLPGLDFLLGFPIQLVGVLMAPLLLIRYLVDGQDVTEDTEATLEKITTLLPGLKK
eukprot:g4922.t1